MSDAASSNITPVKKPANSPLPLYTGDKAEYVCKMFADIAPCYDRLNALLSLRQHKSWRRLAVKLANVKQADICLDVCTGTGDFAVDLAAASGESGKIVASDFCEPMLRGGLAKTAAANGAAIGMMAADTECLPYSSNTFDVVTVGFGIRNVAHIDKAVQEMTRVARPGGRIVILEFNRPRPVWYKPFVDFYLFNILPNIGGLFTRKDAYEYLPRSMKLFVSREELTTIMEAAGLSNVQLHDLNFGTVCIHIGTKLAPAPTEELL